MRIELHPDSLALDQEHQLALAGILALCWTSRHYLVTPDEDALLRWADRHGYPDAVNVVLEDGLRRDATAAPRVGLTVTGGPARWQSNPVLPPVEALELLCSPVRMYVENDQNDRAFVLAFATRSQRDRLEAAADRGWLIWQSGGGASGVAAAAATLASNAEYNPAVAWRTMILLDSDAKLPGQFGTKAAAAQRSLKRAADLLGLAPERLGKVLSRREAENYIPRRTYVTGLAAMLGLPRAADSWEASWAAGRPAPVNDKHRPLQTAMALRHAPATFYAHYDFKFGRASQRPAGAVIHTVDEIWQLAGPHLHPALASGIGEANCRAVIAGARELVDDSGEVRALVQTLVEASDG